MGTVHLVSDSRDYDGALLSLADAVDVCGKVRRWFVSGAQMVNLHILRSGIDAPLRPTQDADIAVRLRTVRQGDLIARLRALGYNNPVYDNRFDREADGLTAQIDLLVASYSTKHQPNIDGGDIGIDGMPAVDEALERDPVVVDLVADRTDGVRLEATVRLPDVVSAIAMKTFAVAERSKPHDAVDLGHLLEVAHADGRDRTQWPKGKAFTAAARQLSAQFDRPGTALADATTSPQRQALLRELTHWLLAPPT